MKFYNTLSAQKEHFSPVQPPNVGMYVCGPTVYDLPHLGHGRAAVTFDVIRKYLIFKGYQVTFVTNYTDIDDKMIQRAEQMKITVSELAERIIPEYARDYGALGVLPGDIEPRATDHVPQMISLIERLENKGATYVLDDGVYFDITKFSDYGKLSKQKMDELRGGARVAVKETKRNAQDFVLWKFSKPGEPSWKSKWGDGRPGWHIECSAMSREYLGDTFDIHGGGADLIFPHHECELAQSEMANNKAFAKYWLHNGFIRINSEKMSKSLGNFFTLRDIFQKFQPQAVRLLFLQTHYRSPIDFTDDILQQSKNSLERLHDFLRRLNGYEGREKSENDDSLADYLKNGRDRFEEGMDDDVDTSIGLATVFDTVKEVNRRMDIGSLSQEGRENVKKFLQNLDMVLGIIFPTALEEVADEKVLKLIREREEARKLKDWKESDRIRDELLKMGIKLEDKAGTTLWKKL